MPTQNNALTSVFVNPNSSKPLRVIDRSGEPWFVAADVCEALGLDNVSLAINGRSDRVKDGLDDDERGIATVNTPSGNQQMLVVSESGLYCLIFKSRRPEAKKFRRWVTSEVLPSIRKTGGYGGSQPKSVSRVAYILNSHLDMGRLLEVPVHISQAIAVSEVQEQTGLDLSRLLEEAPAQVAAREAKEKRERPLEPALAKYLEKTVPDEDYEPISKLMWLFDVTEAQVHTVFRENGLLKSVNKRWERTVEGCKVSKNFQAKPGAYEIRWDTNVVNPMIRGTLDHYPVR